MPPGRSDDILRERHLEAATSTKLDQRSTYIGGDFIVYLLFYINRLPLRTLPLWFFIHHQQYHQQWTLVRGSGLLECLWH